MTSVKAEIAVIGGTGDLGRGLSIRLAAAGYGVIIGSRSQERAEEAATEIAAIAQSDKVRGLANADATAAGEMVILAVPYSAHSNTLNDIKTAATGKVVVDTTVPLKPPKVMRVQLPEAGSAAKEARAILGEDVQLVAAFHNVAASKLADINLELDCDVLVFGDSPDARESVVSLAQNIGMTAWHAGSIENAVIAEALTSTLIFLNKKYKIKGAGIKITGEVGV